MSKRKSKIIDCGKCKNNITKTQFSLKCAGDCAKWFHKKCTGLTDEQYIAYEKRKNDEKWICGNCIKKLSDLEDSDLSDDDEIKTNPSNKDILDTFNSKFSELEKALTFNGEIMEQLQITIKTVLEQNKALKKENDLIKIRVETLEKEVIEIKKKLLKNEQEGRNKNIIISGINNDKDIELNVKKVLTKLDEENSECKLSILPSNTGSKNAVVVVQFPTVEQRNRVLEKRKKIILNSQNCSINDSQNKIYINEDLPKPIRELFKKARELKTKGYKYVWCKHGQVYARRSDGGAGIKIQSTAEIEALRRKQH